MARDEQGVAAAWSEGIGTDMNEEHVRILEEAQAIIADPSRWTTGWYAKNAMHENVSPNDEEAVCWCAFGAMYKVLDYSDRNFNMVDSLADYFGGVDVVVHTNDEVGSHGAVMVMFDNAIYNARHAA